MSKKSLPMDKLDDHQFQSQVHHNMEVSYSIKYTQGVRKFILFLTH